MSTETQTYRAIVSLILAIAGARFKLLLPLIAVLGVFMIVDTIIGIRATTYEEKHGIKKGVVSSQSIGEGLFGKVSQLLLIVVGITIDIGVYFGANLIGSTIDIHPIFALVITVTLIGQELFSIAENYTRCGYEPPAWLGDLGQALKKGAESKGDRYVKDITKEITKDEQD